jgi:hypothetical protein
MQGAWFQDGPRLAYRFSSGRRIYPSARDIWIAEFTVPGVLNPGAQFERPSLCIPDLILSRFPARLAVRITGNLFHGLTADLTVAPGAVALPLRKDVSGAWPDQVIYERQWYPIRSDEIESLLNVLTKRRRIRASPSGGRPSSGPLSRDSSLPSIPIRQTALHFCRSSPSRASVASLPMKWVSGRPFR